MDPPDFIVYSLMVKIHLSEKGLINMQSYMYVLLIFDFLIVSFSRSGIRASGKLHVARAFVVLFLDSPSVQTFSDY